MKFDNEITWKQYYAMKKDSNFEISPMDTSIPAVKSQREQYGRIYFNVKDKEQNCSYSLFVTDITKKEVKANG